MGIALAIHGGAGTILRSEMTRELEAEYRGGLESALKAGYAILDRGGSSLDAVEAAVCSLEDFPLFNAGRGSVFTHDGRQEMDAAVMVSDVETRRLGDSETGDERHEANPRSAIRNPQSYFPRFDAGAVAAVRNIKNPIKLARLVMERTDHVLLAGEGANIFADQMGVATEPDEYFFTDHRWQQLQDAIAAGRVQLDHFTAETQSRGDLSEPGAVAAGFSDDPKSAIRDPQLGTVGAVACDSAGRLAAATSTGGMTNKKFGRIGDTPIIGSGTYADDLCAVSCTGHGEYFMLGVSAYDVAARMRYKNISLEAAAAETIDRLTQIRGEGGLIAVDTHGNVTLPFNSDGMYRGFAKDGTLSVEIYR